ncbi:MAG: bifunctional phosphoserine phosphatase/homoserine phosphotransferase ThrH [Pseudomonadales bacterium]|nr:bifunctional phosphoserine phosphatase/homoserine phosphotransferase ThrH [Pseudomonadales bacterium]
MNILCLDLEGVLIPEIWIGVAERTGIEGLKLTTRDIPDYDELMTGRLALLREHDLGMADIQAVIGAMAPLPGAAAFLEWARTRVQVAILSDTFYEFAAPLMAQLGHPLLLCHKLTIDAQGRVADYHIRQPDPKRASVRAFHGLNYRCIAAGDSFNDTSMLEEADRGFFFRAPENVRRQFPQYAAADEYSELQALIEQTLKDRRA